MSGLQDEEKRSRKRRRVSDDAPSASSVGSLAGDFTFRFSPQISVPEIKTSGSGNISAPDVSMEDAITEKVPQGQVPVSASEPPKEKFAFGLDQPNLRNAEGLRKRKTKKNNRRGKPSDPDGQTGASESEMALGPVKPTGIPRARLRNTGRRGFQRNFIAIHNHNRHRHGPGSSESGDQEFLDDDKQKGWLHGDRPLVLMNYLQVFFNAALISFILYLAYWFIQTIQNDLTEKVEEVQMGLYQERSLCSQKYTKNRCQPETRVPAMEKRCSEWEHCMNKVPSAVGRARLGSETLADIANGFVDVMSWKTMLFILFVFSVIVFANVSIGSYRRSYSHTGQRFGPYDGHNMPPSLPGLGQSSGGGNQGASGGLALNRDNRTVIKKDGQPKKWSFW